MRLTSLTALSVMAAIIMSQARGQDAAPASSTPRSTPAIGETVSAIDDRYTMALQDKDNNYWFSNGSKGVYRYDGKRITRFTTGLSRVSCDSRRGREEVSDVACISA